MFDLAVIGGGPAGYVAAERAGAAGLKVVLFEGSELGGVCLNEGCIPTKTLLYGAKLYDNALHSEKYGVSAGDVSFDWLKMLKRKEKTVRRLVAGVKLRLANAGVEVVKENAFIEGRTPEGFTVTAGPESYCASRLLVCTGSEAFLPPVPGLVDAGDVVMTSRELLAVREVPASLVIIGGGVIGIEFASLFNSLGSRVTVIEMLPSILGPMDGEVSSILQKQYARKGIDFRLGCRVSAIEGHEVVSVDSDGVESRVSGDRILVSVGRRARLSGFGLENTGVECGRGVKVDDRMRTSVPGIWAAGDVTGFSMLAHAASREAEVAVDDMLGRDVRMNYDAIPGVVYTNPEAAGTGLTEAEAAARGIAYSVLKLPMTFSGRFVAENELGEGICKILVDQDSHRILGAHMLGNSSSEIISGLCIAIEKGMTAEQLRQVVFPHPTVSEIVRETLLTL